MKELTNYPGEYITDVIPETTNMVKARELFDIPYNVFAVFIRHENTTYLVESTDHVPDTCQILKYPSGQIYGIPVLLLAGNSYTLKKSKR